MRYTKPMFSALAVASLLVAAVAQAADAKNAAKSEACSDEARYQEIEKVELSKLVDSKSVFVIDVNSKESFAKAHVPGAIHYGTQKSSFETALPKDKNALIVAYCGGPACTAWKSAATAACKLGYQNVKHFKGGISGWIKKEG